MNDRDSRRAVWRAAAALSSSGLQLVLFIWAGARAGQWLDLRFHTGQTYATVGVMTGLAMGVGGFVLLVWMAFREP